MKQNLLGSFILWYRMNVTLSEFDFQLKIDGKTYLASSNQKKAAKQAFELINTKEYGPSH